MAKDKGNWENKKRVWVSASSHGQHNTLQSFNNLLGFHFFKLQLQHKHWLFQMKLFHAENATFASPVKGFLGQPCNMTLDVVFWVVNSILGVVILLGNTLACVVFLTARHLRNKYMNIYLVSLAFSDICIWLSL